MIPKIIHYCWFGGNPKPDDVKHYLASWKKYCPDYEIREWNESNFDINENAYCREAYEAKKWAFVTDYVRLKALYEYGGFYMDTDVEVVKSLEPLRVYDALSGYESPTHIPTGTMGACRDNEWIGMLLRDYDNRHFILEDGTLDMTTNVIVITELTVKKYGIHLNGEMTPFGNNMMLLPFDYLCAKSYQTGEVTQTKNTFTIHHFAGSWASDEVKERSRFMKEYYAQLGWIPMEGLRKKTASILAYRKQGGWSGVLRKIMSKV
ncbi:MAG: Glycosyl transferase [Mitsuokella multacida]|jgi:hypothetical protein